MGLDGLDTLEGDEGGSEGGAEQQSEKQREKAAKALSGIKRTQKDEQKAKRDNDFLYECLRKIISSKRYDALIPLIFPLFSAEIPSNFIIGVFSLVYKGASDIIRKNYTRSPKNVQYIDFVYTPLMTPLEFDENTLDPIIRGRINAWVEDIFAAIGYDPSVILTEKFLRIASTKAKKDIIHFMSGTLVFFLESIHINISEEKAHLYAEFILGEVRKNLEGLKLEKF
ncbi:MAG: hypothetical protein Q8K26_02420 [Candidatus Gracilibacteria bacterium]|nr:hypothetical protein [Candidatus Gracilibacteria bacterium]